MLLKRTVDLSEPSTFQEAVNGPDQVHWRKAIRAELKSMRLRGVFRAAKLPNGQRAIGTKWVFKIKRKSGRIDRKVQGAPRGKGFKQKYGIDYTETLSPVGQVRDAAHGHRYCQVLRLASRQLDVVTGVPVRNNEGQVFCIVPEGVELAWQTSTAWNW
ncbi:hypothetical protein Pcac1_g23447 [Phytophthora cactorum]|nr:hypothetical protein Pcac1_g23447 [Phytophthora cactorum]